MRSNLSRTIVLIAIALSFALAATARARAADIEPSLNDQKATVDKQDRLHLDASAELNAPVAKVFEAMSNPEKVAKYDNNVTGTKVISHDGTGKIVEFDGQTLPIPNAPKSLQVKYTFDPAKQVVKSRSVGKALVQFNTETTLKPSKDGKSTEITYTSVSSSAGKIMGVETPKFMRQQFALESFMRGLRNVGQYIQHGGK